MYLNIEYNYGFNCIYCIYLKCYCVQNEDLFLNFPQYKR